MKEKRFVYFVRKDTPLLHDYRFGHGRTPEAALKFRIYQWWPGEYGHMVAHKVSGPFDTREEAMELASKYNAERVAGFIHVKQH